MFVARGGIPVCFPQFSDFGPLSQHGFARNSPFEVQSRTADTVTLVLRSSEATLKLWPHAFELLVTVRVPSTSPTIELVILGLCNTRVGSLCIDATICILQIMAIKVAQYSSRFVISSTCLSVPRSSTTNIPIPKPTSIWCNISSSHQIYHQSTPRSRNE